MSHANSSSPFTTSGVGPPMIGALMRLPWEAVVSRMLRALHENGFADIEPAHLTLLLWPGPDGMRPSELAARTRMTKQAVNYLLGSLERLGYLERRPDPGDARGRRIALTERGRALVPVLRSAVAEAEREWAAAVGEERYAALRELLIELNDVVAAERAAEP